MRPGMESNGTRTFVKRGDLMENIFDVMAPVLIGMAVGWLIMILANRGSG